MSEAKITNRRRIARRARTAGKIKAAENRPKLLVFRSNKHIYAQLVDVTGKVLAAASDMKATTKSKMEAAAAVGAEIAEKATAHKVTEVSFDRRGYKYHGRVKAVADAAREKGLTF